MCTFYFWTEEVIELLGEGGGGGRSSLLQCVWVGVVGEFRSSVIYCRALSPDGQCISSSYSVQKKISLVICTHLIEFDTFFRTGVIVHQFRGLFLPSISPLIKVLLSIGIFTRCSHGSTLQYTTLLDVHSRTDLWLSSRMKHNVNLYSPEDKTIHCTYLLYEVHLLIQYDDFAYK